jgi:BRCT domain type II-containing protein
MEALAPEIAEPAIEPATPVETAIDALADVAPEPKPALKVKKPASPKAD